MTGTRFDLGRNADGPLNATSGRAHSAQILETRRRDKLKSEVDVLETLQLVRPLRSGERVLLRQLRSLQEMDEANDARRAREQEQREAMQRAHEDHDPRRR